MWMSHFTHTSMHHLVTSTNISKSWIGRACEGYSNRKANTFSMIVYFNSMEANMLLIHVDKPFYLIMLLFLLCECVLSPLHLPKQPVEINSKDKWFVFAACQDQNNRPLFFEGKKRPRMSQRATVRRHRQLQNKSVFLKIPAEESHFSKLICKYTFHAHHGRFIFEYVIISISI